METISVTSKKSAAILAGRNTVKVWLVDDNHNFRETLVNALGRIEGVICSQNFPNAEDALDAMMGGGKPDVVLLDVELPGQDGIQAVQKFKSISPSTHVIMLTAFDDHEKIFKALCAGASGYLLKTAPLGKIMESIHEVLVGGAPMTPKVASSVLQMFLKMARPKQDYSLTERDRKILELMTQGLIKKEIADKLSLNYHTVDAHLRNIYVKLHVHSRSGAVAKALKERLV
jgi:DNA-binding NarL/FixJ family response regulator